MKKLFPILSIIALLAWLPSTGLSQQVGDDAILSRSISKANNLNSGFSPQVNISIGSSFGSFAPGITTFGAYFMPQMSVPVTKRFSISAGIGYTSLFAGFANEGSMFSNAPQQYGSVYVKGVYQLNQKVTVSALGYKTFNLQQTPHTETLNPHALDMSNQGVMINLNYKVNDKVQINASFSYDKRNYNPYYFNRGMRSSGFYNPAVGGGFENSYFGF